MTYNPPLLSQIIFISAFLPKRKVKFSNQTKIPCFMFAFHKKIMTTLLKMLVFQLSVKLTRNHDHQQIHFDKAQMIANQSSRKGYLKFIEGLFELINVILFSPLKFSLFYMRLQLYFEMSGNKEDSSAKMPKINENSSSEFQVDEDYGDSISNQSDSVLKRKEKRKAMKQRIQRINKKKNHGDWLKEEEQKFLTYMIENKNLFETDKSRRQHKVFKNMATILKTRSSVQCRSHHQKLLGKHGTFELIAHHLQMKINSSLESLNNEQNSEPKIGNSDSFSLKKKFKQHNSSGQRQTWKSSGQQKDVRSEQPEKMVGKNQDTWKQQNIVGKDALGGWVIYKDGGLPSINRIVIKIQDGFFNEQQNEA